MDGLLFTSTLRCIVFAVMRDLGWWFTGCLLAPFFCNMADNQFEEAVMSIATYEQPHLCAMWRQSSGAAQQGW